MRILGKPFIKVYTAQMKILVFQYLCFCINKNLSHCKFFIDSQGNTNGRDKSDMKIGHKQNKKRGHRQTKSNLWNCRKLINTYLKCYWKYYLGDEALLVEMEHFWHPFWLSCCGYCVVAQGQLLIQQQPEVQRVNQTAVNYEEDSMLDKNIGIGISSVVKIFCCTDISQIHLLCNYKNFKEYFI